MYTSALVAALHFLTIGLGFAGVWIRGRGLRAGDVPTTLYGDNVWGVAAVFWLGTGLARAFGGLEKGTAWYLNSPLFWVKMGLFALVMLLELWPMITFIRWRVRLGRGEAVDTSVMPVLARINTVEIALTAAIPFVAVAMARGLV